MVDDGTYAMKKVLIQNSEQLELVREEIRVSSLFSHQNLLPLLDHAIISVKVSISICSLLWSHDVFFSMCLYCPTSFFREILWHKCLWFIFSFNYNISSRTNLWKYFKEKMQLLLFGIRVPWWFCLLGNLLGSFE